MFKELHKSSIVYTSWKSYAQVQRVMQKFKELWKSSKVHKSSIVYKNSKVYESSKSLQEFKSLREFKEFTRVQSFHESWKSLQEVKVFTRVQRVYKMSKSYTRVQRVIQELEGYAKVPMYAKVQRVMHKFKESDKRWIQHPVKMLEKCKKKLVLLMKNTPRVSTQHVPVCTFKTSPCMPAPRTHVFDLSKPVSGKVVSVLRGSTPSSTSWRTVCGWAFGFSHYEIWSVLPAGAVICVVCVEKEQRGSSQESTEKLFDFFSADWLFWLAERLGASGSSASAQDLQQKRSHDLGGRVGVTARLWMFKKIWNFFFKKKIFLETFAKVWNVL